MELSADGIATGGAGTAEVSALEQRCYGDADQTWETDARREDREAELTEDLWR